MSRPSARRRPTTPRPRSSSSTRRSAAAWKDYLGNAALHGIAATVFAQLITNGVNHGVHCFYVPLRDENGEFLPGIGGEDDGAQGRPQRHRQRPPALRPRPRAAHEPAQQVRRRRGRRHVLERDPQPRPPLLHDARHARAGSRVARRRRDRGHRPSACTSRSPTRTSAASSTPAPAPTRSCCSTTASTSAACCTRLAHDVRVRSSRTTSSCRSSTPSSAAAPTPDADREDLETLAAALKPLSTWHALDTLQEAREACGGAGFLVREPPGRAARRPRHLRRPSRATTTCCCSSSASGC